MACKEAGVTPTFREWLDTGTSLVNFVISLNLKRRHLNSSQLAAISPAIERAFAAEARERQLAVLKQGTTFKCLSCHETPVSYSGQFCKNCLEKAETVLEHAEQAGAAAADSSKPQKTSYFYENEFDETNDDYDGSEANTDGFGLGPVVQKSSQREKSNNNSSGKGKGRAVDQTASALGTNRRYVSEAKRLAETAPDLLDHVKSGLIIIPEATVLAKLETVEQRQQALELIRSKQAKDAYAAKRMVEQVARTEQVGQWHKQATAANDEGTSDKTQGLYIIEQNDNIAHIADGSIDLVLTDPPYNISKNGGLTKLGNQVVAAEFDSGDDSNWDSASREDYLRALEGWVVEWTRVTRPGGAVISFIDKALVSYLWDFMAAHGLQPKSITTWVKDNAQPSALIRRNLISSTEFLVWAVKPGAAYTFNDDTDTAGWDRRNFITTHIISAAEKVDHPTQKPLAVITPLMLLASNPGDLVLDPFGGSGTTAVTAAMLGRRCHSVERNPDYVALAQWRLHQTIEQLRQEQHQDEQEVSRETK